MTATRDGGDPSPGELDSIRARSRGVMDARTRSQQLGSMLVAREDPRIVICDPHLVASARPLQRLLRTGDSTWTVRLVEAPIEGVWRVVAAVAEESHLVLPPPTPKARRKAAPLPALRWERARFEDGADTYPVDFATAAITDASCAAKLRSSAALRDRVLAHCNGPPGCELFDHTDGTCEVAWFDSGLGDGRYGAWWGVDPGGIAVVLVAPFLTLPT